MPPQQVQGPRWIAPEVEVESDEFTRTAESFGMSPTKMMDAAKNGQLVELPFSIWGQIENTDSFDVGSLSAVDSRAKGYGRDTTSLKQAYSTGARIPAPIIWWREDGSYYLIAGNTRLMLAKAFGLRPKVFIFRY